MPIVPGYPPLGPAGAEVRPRRTSGGGPEPGRGAVGHLHLLLPRDEVLPGHQVLHERVRTVRRAALDGDVAAVPELVDVVLDPPGAAGVVRAGRHHLGGDDAVRCAVAVDDDGAVDVAHHGLALGPLARRVGAGQAD